MKRIVGPPEVRFWRKVDATAGQAGCWSWLGGLTSKGYGSFVGADRRAVRRAA